MHHGSSLLDNGQRLAYRNEAKASCTDPRCFVLSSAHRSKVLFENLALVTMVSRIPFCLLICIGIVGVDHLCPERAFAGNDDEILLGKQAMMTGGAVTATVADGSSLWYNPAGLAAPEVSTLDVTASAFTLRKYSLPAFLATESGVSADADPIEFLAVPSSITYVRELNPRVHLGFGIFVSKFSDLEAKLSLEERSGSEVSNWLFNFRILSKLLIALSVLLLFPFVSQRQRGDQAQTYMICPYLYLSTLRPLTRRAYDRQCFRRKEIIVFLFSGSRP